jgi:hypothetical protein
LIECLLAGHRVVCRRVGLACPAHSVGGSTTGYVRSHGPVQRPRSRGPQCHAYSSLDRPPVSASWPASCWSNRTQGHFACAQSNLGRRHVQGTAPPCQLVPLSTCLRRQPPSSPAPWDCHRPCDPAGRLRAWRSQSQKNSVVSSPRAVTNDSTSMPSLKTIFPNTSAALNERAEATPGRRPVRRVSADRLRRDGVWCSATNGR